MLAELMGLFIGLVVVAFLVASPIVALVAISRVRALERRVASLEGAPDGVGTKTPASPVLPAPPEAPGEPSGGPPETGGVVAATERTVEHDVAPAGDAPGPAAETGTDWEAAVAGRWLNRVGLLAVAIGVSYFLKLAIDSEWIGPRGQVVAGMVTGLGLVAGSAFIGSRLRYFADGIAGLGASVLYLSIWAAGSYYHLISPGLAFVSMAAVTIAITGLALSRGSAALAGLAMVGGFLTPALVSTGSNAQVVLFLYLAIQNTALLVLARLRDWRFLELPAFAFTQLYFWNWFDRFYVDGAAVRTLSFAVLFFLQFSALPVIRLRVAGPFRREQGVLVLANAAFILGACHAVLWPGRLWALTAAVLVLSAVHFLLARALPRPSGDESPARVLLFGLALTFATMAVPIRLEGHWVPIALAVEAGVLAWSGFKLRIWHLRAAAIALFAVAGLCLLGMRPSSSTFIFNAPFGAALVVAGSAAVAVWRARQCRDQQSPLEAMATACLGVAANILMLAALTREVYHYFDVAPVRGTAAFDSLLAQSLTHSLLWIGYATGLVLLGTRLRAAALRWQGLALLGMTTLKVFFVDLGYLSGVYRIVSSIALGLVLLALSLLYQRRLASGSAPDRAPAEGDHP